MGVDVMRDSEDKFEGSTHLGYTGLVGGLEHLKIETRLRGERFENAKGEYVMIQIHQI